MTSHAYMMVIDHLILIDNVRRRNFFYLTLAIANQNESIELIVCTWVEISAIEIAIYFNKYIYI